MKNGGNVLFIPLGVNEEGIWNRLISRHSCDKKFEKQILLDELDDVSIRREEHYQEVYKDFVNNFADRLIILAEKHPIVSHHFLRTYIVGAEREFLERTGKGIDLIVIDNFDYMKLYENSRIITGRDRVITEYYKFLSSQSIPVLVTMCANSKRTF